MSNKTIPTIVRLVVYKLIVVILLFSLTIPALATSVSTTRVDRQTYDITPSTGTPGREYTILILCNDSTKAEIRDTTQLVPPGEITVSGVKRTTKASLTAKIFIPRDTPIGRYRFLLKDNDGTDANIIGIADFEVTAIGQGPVPPGIDPQVDLMWGVMPAAIVRHNFGRQIANNYYGVQIRIGNDSGYDLQLAGVGFKLRNSGLKNIIPSNSYRATRGTLELEQQVGVRATVVNTIKALGTLYSGFLPFWHMPNRRANANLAGEIINGPLERGIELVAPDLTTRQLTHLDDQTLRDGLIVKNNSHIVTLVWIARKTLNLQKDAGDKDEEYKARISPDPQNSSRGMVKNWADDPQYVDWKLGEMVLIGQQVSYVNRIQVISTSEGGGVTPPPSVIGTNIQSAKQGEQGKEIILSGDFLINPTLVGPPGIEFPSADIKADKNAHVLRAKMNVSEDLDPGVYNLTITTEGGQKVVAFTIDPAIPENLDITPKSIKGTDKEQEIKVTITGKFLKDGKLIPKKIENVLEVKDDATGNSKKITQTIKVLAKASKGEQTLEFRAPGGSKTITIKIE